MTCCVFPPQLLLRPIIHPCGQGRHNSSWWHQCPDPACPVVTSAQICWLTPWNFHCVGDIVPSQKMSIYMTKRTPCQFTFTVGLLSSLSVGRVFFMAPASSFTNKMLSWLHFSNSLKNTSQITSEKRMGIFSRPVLLNSTFCFLDRRVLLIIWRWKAMIREVLQNAPVQSFSLFDPFPVELSPWFWQMTLPTLCSLTSPV